MAKKVEEFLVYQKAVDALDDISALVKSSAIGKDFKLRDQLIDACVGVIRSFREGFGQKTDRLFAHYLYYSRGSSGEVRGHLEAALVLNYITQLDFEKRDARYEEISKMLTGLIHYPRLSDRKNRG